MAAAVALILLPMLGIAVSAGPAWADETSTTVSYGGANAEPIDGNELSPIATVDGVDNSYTGGMVTITLGAGSSAQSCSAPVTGGGSAQCSLGQIWQQAGNVPLHIAFDGDGTYGASTSDSLLMVAPETTYLSVSSADSSKVGTPVTLSAQMTVGIYAMYGIPARLIPGQPLLFTLGAGSTAQSCSASTDSTGLASCTIAHNAQPVGTTATAVAFAKDAYQYASAASGSLSTTRVATTLALTSATTVVHGHDLVVTANLLDDLGQPVVSSQGVLASLGSGPGCTTGPALTCTIHDVQGSVGSVPLTLAFAGDSTYQPSSQTLAIMVTPQSTAVVSTTATSAVDGGAFTLSATLTRDTAPAALAGLPVTLTVGSGSSAQSCLATTDQDGLASCVLTLRQTGGSHTVTAVFDGTATYLPSAAQPGTVDVSVPPVVTAVHVPTVTPVAVGAAPGAVLPSLPSLPSPPSLPQTGFALGIAAMLGAGLVGTGAIALLGSRRRRGGVTA